MPIIRVFICFTNDNKNVIQMDTRTEMMLMSQNNNAPFELKATRDLLILNGKSTSVAECRRESDENNFSRCPCIIVLVWSPLAIT